MNVSFTLECGYTADGRQTGRSLPDGDWQHATLFGRWS
jgi:hypothetical protein